MPPSNIISQLINEEIIISGDQQSLAEGQTKDFEIQYKECIQIGQKTIICCHLQFVPEFSFSDQSESIDYLLCVGTR